MEDRALRKAGWDKCAIGRRIRWIRNLTVGLRVVDGCAIPRIKPAYGRHHALETHTSIKGILILRSLNQRQASSRSSIPCLENSRMPAKLLVQRRLIDDKFCILYWNRRNRGIGRWLHGDLLVCHRHSAD